MQIKGYAQALTSADVLAQITSGKHRRIAITYFEWADEKRIASVLPWTVIDGPESAAKAAAILDAHRRQLVGDNCISCAIEEAMRRFDDMPFKTDRKVLDISGDGETNAGRPVLDTRAEALAHDIIINGLPIVTAYEPLLAAYYESVVIGGPGSFIIEARGFEDFGRAVSAKLLREIADGGETKPQLANRQRDQASYSSLPLPWGEVASEGERVRRADVSGLAHAPHPFPLPVGEGERPHTRKLAQLLCNVIRFGAA